PRGGGVGTRGMNGGQTDTFFQPMRPGDVIRARSRLRDWEETRTRLGLTLFSYNETEWWNQNDELVKRRVSTGSVTKWSKKWDCWCPYGSKKLLLQERTEGVTGH